MKTVVAIMLLGVFHFVAAQSQPLSQVKTNVPNLFVSMWNLQYQQQLKRDKAIQLCWATINNHNISGQTQLTGNMVTLDYKSYWPKRNRRSIRYIAPFVRYESFVFEGNLDRVRMRHPGCWVIAGQEITILKRIVIDMFLGVNYFPGHYKVLETDGYMNIDIPPSFRGLGSRAGLSFGYTF